MNQKKILSVFRAKSFDSPELEVKRHKYREIHIFLRSRENKTKLMEIYVCYRSGPRLGEAGIITGNIRNSPAH